MLKLFTLLAATLFASISMADDHMSQELESTVYGSSTALVVSNPTAVVAAMNAFRASDSGKNFPGNVLLNQVVADGTNAATHAINVFYPSAAAMDMVQSAPPSAAGMQMISTLQASADPTERFVFRMQRGRGLASEPGNLTLIIGLEVTDGAAFLKAFDKLWNSAAMKDFPGGTYFGDFMADGDAPATHWVSFVAKDMASLSAGMDAVQGSKAMAAYLQDANAFRKVTRNTMYRTVLAFRAGQ